MSHFYLKYIKDCKVLVILKELIFSFVLSIISSKQRYNERDFIMIICKENMM